MCILFANQASRASSGCPEPTEPTTISTPIDIAELKGLRQETHRTLGFGFVGLLLAFPLLAELIEANLLHIAISVLVYAAIAVAIVMFLPLHLPQSRFGPANRISLLRGLIIAVLAGFAWNTPASPDVEWVVFILASCALVLDGVDGTVARRSGMASELGARLDRELDGLLTLVLCCVIYLSGRVEAFVLIAGMMHYAFLVARKLNLMSATSLPPSFRRQAAGVLSSVLLVVCCAPSMGASVDMGLALTVIVLLTTSFSCDIIAGFRTTSILQR